MVNYVYYTEKDGQGQRHMAARPIRSREEYMSLRDSEANRRQVAKVRRMMAEGAKDDEVKREKFQLLKFAYNDLMPDGTVKNASHPSSTFFHDIDLYDGADVEDLKQRVLQMKDELGLLELSGSVSGGLHLICRRQQGRTILESQVRVAMLLHAEMDTNNDNLERIVLTTTSDDLFYLDDALFTDSMTPEQSTQEMAELTLRQMYGQEEVPEGAKKANKHYRPWEDKEAKNGEVKSDKSALLPNSGGKRYASDFKGIPYSEIIVEYWRRTGGEPTEGERNKRLHQLAANLRAICDNSEEWLMELMPRYGLSAQEMQSIVHSACKEPTKGSRLMDQIVFALKTGTTTDETETAEDEESLPLRGDLEGSLSTKKLPQGIRDSIDAVGPQLAMPVVTAVCPCIGALATGVTLDVHGQKKGLNLIAYIAGDFASGKGQIDPVVEAWMSEVKALDTMYQMQENEWRAKKRAAKNKKEQPEEPKLPVRCLTLNNTVANLAERLANTEGKHAFSFTPEADTVAQKWKTAMSDFSIMLRQSYDGTSYEREARSAEAVNVHIKRLLWNVTLCGTPDALYRVVSNYTDGFQSRIAIARTPDNTFAPLELKPYVLTDRQRDRIQQVAHLLPLMQGEVVLPKLEARGRTWLERIRLETMMNDDKVRARQRFRVCVTAQRMTCCLMLCKVCETLIQKHGLNAAETQMKQNPNLWREMLMKAQTPQMLEAYDIIADSLLENALHFFRDRIENAFNSRDYAGSIIGERQKRGRNDSIYGRLDVQFTFEQAMQHAVAVKGAGVTHNSVRQMLKNWRKQGLIILTDEGRYMKSEK